MASTNLSEPAGRTQLRAVDTEAKALGHTDLAESGPDPVSALRMASAALNEAAFMHAAMRACLEQLHGAAYESANPSAPGHYLALDACLEKLDRVIAPALEATFDALSAAEAA